MSCGGGPPKFGGPCGGGCCGGCAPKPGGGKFASDATIVPPSGLTLLPPPKSGGGAGGGGVIGGGAAAPRSGIFAEPGIGGATPTIVPLSLLGGGPAGRGGIAPPGGAGGGAFEPAPCACWLDMSIVPLNFGAAAPFKLNPHLMHVTAFGSSFFVPQFGQNTATSRIVFGNRGSIAVMIARKQGERLP